MTTRKYPTNGWMGKKLGDWTVIEDASYHRGSQRILKVRCKCGLVAERNLNKLMQVASCCISCYRNENSIRDDQTGKTFNDWTVIRRVEGKGNNTWLCQCKCGTQAEKFITTLKHKAVKRCRRCHDLARQEDFWVTFLKRAKKGAAKRHHSFDVTVEHARDLLEKQGHRCALSGVPIYMCESITELKSGIQTASLDRIDSNIGYAAGNIQWVHKWINFMKMDFPEKEFIYYCAMVAQHSAFYSPPETFENWLLRLSNERKQKICPVYPPTFCVTN